MFVFLCAIYAASCVLNNNNSVTIILAVTDPGIASAVMEFTLLPPFRLPSPSLCSLSILIPLRRYIIRTIPAP